MSQPQGSLWVVPLVLLWVAVGVLVSAQGLSAPAPISVSELVFSERGDLVGTVDSVLMTETRLYVLVSAPRPPTNLSPSVPRPRTR